MTAAVVILHHGLSKLASNASIQDTIVIGSMLHTLKKPLSAHLAPKLFFTIQYLFTLLYPTTEHGMGPLELCSFTGAVNTSQHSWSGKEGFEVV